MPFATDRDLLALDPNLFFEIAWDAQRRVTSDNAQLTSGLLSAPGVDFADAQIDPGFVAILDGSALEVSLRPSPATLLLSHLRARADDPELIPGDIAGAKLRISTFQPQIELAHHELMQSLDIDETQESSITNPRDVALLEAAMTLRRIYDAARSAPDANACRALNDRRIARLRAWLRARLDLGDGATETRSLDTPSVTRG